MNFDFFLLELLNIAGDIIDSRKTIEERKINKILTEVMKKSKAFFSHCMECKNGCLREPMKRISYKSLLNKGLMLIEFPDTLQNQVCINFFYFEFMNDFCSSVSEDLEKYIEEENACGISESVFNSVVHYISKSCWEKCDSK